jgi:formylglycine-generating enzyme required for sulfatase activity
VSPANTDGAETVFVPGGVFLLGSNAADSAALPHEMPEHKVALSGFNIYTHEVTNSMYQACVVAGNCLPVDAFRSDLMDYTTNPIYAENPVIGADWFMAKSYCEWANGRLPTEAEWEAAGRGIDDRIYPWGNTNADCSNNMMLGCGKENLPAMVGLFANGNSPYKGWDMAGNTWEWVNDWYDANSYSTVADSNPYGPWQSDYKVVRGGGWNSPGQAVRSANRIGIDPSLSYKDLGFRCVANGFPTLPHISVTEERHSHREGSGEVVEEIPRTGRTPGESSRSWSWGRLHADCGAGGMALFSIPVWNSFGGTYSASVDGTPAACIYDAASGWLSCSFPIAPARSGEAGAEFYQFVFTLIDPSGSTLPDGNYTIGVGSGLYSTCTSTGLSCWAWPLLPSTAWHISGAQQPYGKRPGPGSGEGEGGSPLVSQGTGHCSNRDTRVGGSQEGIT